MTGCPALDVLETGPLPPDSPLALRWEHGTWAGGPVTGAGSRGYLAGVACGTRCWAVGGRTSMLGDGSSYSHPLIVTVAGT